MYVSKDLERILWFTMRIFLVVMLLLSGATFYSASAQLRKATKLTLSPETFTLSSGQNITLVARLTTLDGKPLAGKTIFFTASLGFVYPSTAITNEEGVTSTVYRAPEASIRVEVTVVASFLGDSLYEGSTATSKGVIEPRLPVVSVSGASFTVPETLKDEVLAYRNSIPEDVLRLLPVRIPSESFILASPEDLYLVFANQSGKGLAYVEGWRLPQSINLGGISLSVIVARSVRFEIEGIPVSISEILRNPDNYKFKLVKVNAFRNQISVLYDPDESPYVEFPLTIGYLIEKPAKPLDIPTTILNEARNITLDLDKWLVGKLSETVEKDRLWFFNFEYEYWYEAPAVTNGIVIPADHPIFKLINQSMPILGIFTYLSGSVVLYDVNTLIPYEEVPSVSYVASNYERYLGKVVKVKVNALGGYVSIQEIIEHNTPCGEDYVYIERIGCVNIVVDVRLEGLLAWNSVSIPPKREELLTVLGVSSFHQDMPFEHALGVFELIGKVISTKQISNSLPEGTALLVYQARKVGELDLKKLAQQFLDEVRGRVSELLWVLQDIYPYTKIPSIPYKVPERVFNPRAPILVKTPEEIPKVVFVERSITITVASVPAGAQLRLNIGNSAITNISIVLKKEFENVTIFFEKLAQRPQGIPEPPGSVYAYFNISVNVSREVIKGVNITFWVEKEWLIRNNALAEYVTMVRYHTGRWVELPTRVLGGNATHYQFTAETPEFSIFAMIVKTAVPPTTPTPTPSPTPTPIPTSTPTPTLTPTIPVTTPTPTPTTREVETTTPTITETKTERTAIATSPTTPETKTEVAAPAVPLYTIVLALFAIMITAVVVYLLRRR